MIHYLVYANNKTKKKNRSLEIEIAKRCKKEKIFFYFYTTSPEDTSVMFCLGLPEETKNHNIKKELVRKILKSLGIGHDVEFKAKDIDGEYPPLYNKKIDRFLK